MHKVHGFKTQKFINLGNENVFFYQQAFFRIWRKMDYYCWWLKSCTTWDAWKHRNNGINYLSTGAGFQPSTVSIVSKTAYSSRRIADRIAFGFFRPTKIPIFDENWVRRRPAVPQGSKGQTYHQIPHLENFPGGIWILLETCFLEGIYYIYVSFFLILFFRWTA